MWLEVGHIRSHVKLIGLCSVVVDGELDYPIDEVPPLLGGQTVGVDKDAELARSVLKGREALNLRDVVSVKLRVQPAGLPQLDEGIDGGPRSPSR